jgi:hypothetical protein
VPLAAASLLSVILAPLTEPPMVLRVTFRQLVTNLISECPRSGGINRR